MSSFSGSNLGRKIFRLFEKSCCTPDTITKSWASQGGQVVVGSMLATGIRGGIGIFSYWTLGEPKGVCGGLPLLSPRKRVKISLVGKGGRLSHYYSIFWEIP